MICCFWQCPKDLKNVHFHDTQHGTILVATRKYLVTSVIKVLSGQFYIANRIRKATIKQKSPIASDRANPRMAYENSCCFRDGFLWTTTTTTTKSCIWIQLEMCEKIWRYIVTRLKQTWHNQWWDYQTLSRFQHQILRLQQWQLRHQ